MRMAHQSMTSRNRARGIQSHRRRRLLAAILGVCLALGAGACSGATTRHDDRVCGPFGAAPVDLIEAEQPYCWGGARLGPWQDSNGTERYACLYEPGTLAQGGAALPMVVFLHPSLFGTWTIHRTNLLHFQDSFAMGAKGARGFILLAPAGRDTTHYYPFPDQKGVGWDNWYRQLNPAGDVKLGDSIYRENVDAATIDHFIAQEMATGRVDRQRVYITGWSNGAAMAYLYALNRPGIAAAAVYSAPDPFSAFDDPCKQKPVARPPKEPTEIQIFNPRLASLHIHNNCDLVGLCPNSQLLTSQLATAGVSASDIIMNWLGSQVSECMAACGTDPNGDVSNPLGWTLGAANHSRWPRTWTSTMLAFFGGHPLK
jgi:pimeloyl-ACP methyl ester carboxylesterase